MLTTNQYGNKEREFYPPTKRRRPQRIQLEAEIDGINRCANCLVVFNKPAQRNRDMRVHDPNLPNHIVVPIKKALAFVFESLGTTEDIQSENSEFLTDSDEFFVCSNCAKYLSRLYSAFKCFAILGKEKSKIYLKLSKLRSRKIEEEITEDVGCSIVKEEPVDEFILPGGGNYMSRPNNINNPTKYSQYNFIPEVSIRKKAVVEVINLDSEDKSSEAVEKVIPDKVTYSEEQIIIKDVVSLSFKPVKICSNCAISFNEKIRKISAISVKGENERNIPVPIKKALAFVFESVGNKLDFLQLKHMIFMTDFENEKMLYLCLNCALSLGQLYQTYKHFTDLETLDSEIGKHLKQLRVRKQGEECLPLPPSKPPTINCSNCNKCFNENLRKISAISVSGAEKKNIPVPIKKALAFVFESFGDGHEVNWTKSIFLGDTTIVGSLFLCFTCALSLGKFYKAFKHFTELGITQSEIGIKLKRLRYLYQIDVSRRREEYYRYGMNSLTTPNKSAPSSTSNLNDGNKGEISNSITKPTEDGETNQENSSKDPVVTSAASSNVAGTSGSNSKSYVTEIKKGKHDASEQVKTYSKRRRGPKTLKYSCSICKKGYSRKDYLTMHYAFSHRKNDNQPFTCEICGVDFVNISQLKLHNYMRHRKGEKCDICQKVFNSKRGINAHRTKCKKRKVGCRQDAPSL